MKATIATSVLGLAACASLSAESPPVRVLVWDERQAEQLQTYDGRYLGQVIASHLAAQPGWVVAEAWRDQPEDGLTEEVLDRTDVIVWWSHKVPRNVPEATSKRVVDRVMKGSLSLIALHSAHWSRPFVRLMQERAKLDAAAAVPDADRAGVSWQFANDEPWGKVPGKSDPPTPHVTINGQRRTLTLPACVFPAWRADGQPSRVTTLLPEHPISSGLSSGWTIPQTEMYAEPFHVPAPDAVVFEESWASGERFRSGCLWKVGRGQVFYFRPGHETYPIFKQAENLRVIVNATAFLGKH